MWDWIPDPTTLLSTLGEPAERWEPHPGLKIDSRRVQVALVDGAASAAPWLRHPCVSRLTHHEPTTALRDLVLAVWAAAHTDADLGTVELAGPVMLWSANGDHAIEPGRHELGALGALAAMRAPVAIGLDVWCSTTGLPTAAAYDADAESFGTLGHDLNQFVRVMHALEARLPSVATWLAAATRVVRPLVPVAGCTRSTHYPQIMGLVEADLSRGPATTIELVVHETAHLHLRAAQADDPLVDPAHTGTYPSPLRPEPRPLIGILLAYHALAYIAAALEASVAAGLLGDHILDYVGTDVAPKRDDARSVLDGAVHTMTDHGCRFLERTHEVSHHVAV